MTRGSCLDRVIELSNSIQFVYRFRQPLREEHARACLSFRNFSFLFFLLQRLRPRDQTRRISGADPRAPIFRDAFHANQMRARATRN